jgi:aminomethyltransferase
MGQAFLIGERRGDDKAHEAVAAAMEALVPGEIRKLKRGGQRYSVLLSRHGGVLDDLMISRPFRDEAQGMLFLVVNAAKKDDDFELIRDVIRGRAMLDIAEHRSLIAVQGPKAAAAVERLLPSASAQAFMTLRPYQWRGGNLLVTRSGYTGEDGFEISVPNPQAEELTRTLLADPDVKPIGLGARDSLRLEAGLCLYGHDLDPMTSPVEGNISFVLGKRRREEGGFPGADRILKEFVEGPKRLRVGLRPEGRAPAREGAEIESLAGEKIGIVTSGGFGPTLNAPIAMGYVDAAHSKTGTRVNLVVRGKPLPAVVADMPFVPHRYYRGQEK